jgi:beta-glucanase (GH16 family)
VCLAALATAGAGSAAISLGGGAATAPYHKPVFSYEFQGRAGSRLDPRQWIHDVGRWGSTNGELETDTAGRANSSLDGHGDLAIVARRAHGGGRRGTLPYTSARIVTRRSFTYGRVEARIEIPAGAGLASAFWMLGSDIDRVGWPACGEIDVVEATGGHPFAADGHIHGPSGGGSYAIGGTAASPASLAASFHTYGIDWRPGSITWTLDGRAYLRLTPRRLASGARWAFDHPFNIVLNLAVGGTPGGAPGRATPFPARLLVAWIRVYQ